MTPMGSRLDVSLPPGIRALRKESFDSLCPFNREMSTPLAWFVSRDRSSLGLLSATCFVAMTFRNQGGTFVPSSEVGELDERSLATQWLVEMMADV